MRAKFVICFEIDSPPHVGGADIAFHVGVTGRRHTGQCLRHPETRRNELRRSHTAAVLGGIGSLPGAVIGGLLIGLIETMWSAYFSIDYKDVAAFSILAITLIFMPQGLLGRPDVEKV